jgi:hypothetical protein
MTRSISLFIAMMAMVSGAAGDSLTRTSEEKADTFFFNHLLVTGRGDLAALEYERLLHGSSGVPAGLSCRFGDALLKGGDYDGAVYAFENALDGAEADSGSYLSAKLGIARSYILQRKPLLALNELGAFGAEAGSGRDTGIVSFYKSAAFAAAYSLDSSRKILSGLATHPACLDKAKRLDTLIAWYKSSGMKDPFYAYLYSSVIPGWGHWRIGDRLKAVKSFALMAGLTGILGFEGYLFYRGNRQQRYVIAMDMFIVGGLLWRRYYNGIRKAAYDRAVEYNQHVQIEYQRRLSEIVSE